MKAEVTIEGKAADGRLWYPEMSLSSSRARGIPAPYEISVCITDFLEVLEPVWVEAVNELRRDDQITGELDALGEADYPVLRELLERPALLIEAMNFLEEEFFEAFLPPAKPAQAGSAGIDSLDEIFALNGRVHARGICFCF